jgi:hypothetical protein
MYTLTDGVFHCFTNRKMAEAFVARTHINRLGYLAVIRLDLSGTIIHGEHYQFSDAFDGKPSVCGTTATWDGLLLYKNKYIIRDKLKTILNR